jgi:hypothetical protein
MKIIEEILIFFLVVLFTFSIGCDATKDDSIYSNDIEYNHEEVLIINNEEELQTILTTKAPADFSGNLVFMPEVKEIRGEWRNAKSITIKEGVESIGMDAFRWSKADIYLPSSITEINSTFIGATGCFSVSEDNPRYYCINSMLIDADTSTLIHINHDQTSVIIPIEVKYIGAEACSHNNRINRVMMPHSVKTIGMMAFSDCPNLVSVQLSKDLEELTIDVFTDSPIKQLVIPPHVQFIYDESNNMFGGNNGPRSLVIEGNEIAIRKKDFYGENTSLQYIVFTSTPPKEYDEGTFRLYAESFVIYYINDYRQAWAPNGENLWDGITIIGIDTLNDLPSV